MGLKRPSVFFGLSKMFERRQGNGQIRKVAISGIICG
jgi:hypothetical protein